jgi:hypothetical protein
VSRAFEKDTGQVVKEGMERAIAGANFKRHEKQALASTTVLALADSAVQPAAGVAGALLPLAALAGQRAGEKMATTQFVFSQMAGGSSSDTTSASSTQGKRVFTRSFNASAEKVESGLRELKAELLRIARAGKSKAEDPTDDRTGKQLTGFRLRYASGETRGEARVTVTGTEKTGYSVHIIIEETIP